VKAHEYAAVIGPLHEPPPVAPGATLAQRREALHDALRGVQLGPFDEAMVGWFVDHLDELFCKVLIGWLVRAHSAGVHDACTIAEAGTPPRRAVGRAAVPEPELPLWVEGGSGGGMPLPRRKGRGVNER
jgi:hypothetical protein